MDKWTTKRLEQGDLRAYRKLMSLFADAFDEKDTYGDSPPSDKYANELMSDSGFVALVAEDPSGQVVGGLCAYRLRKFEQERSEYYLYDLAVAAEWRRRGIATALIDDLKSIACADGAWVIFVQADHGDDPAIELYTSLGTREDVLHFDIDVHGR